MRRGWKSAVGMGTALSVLVLAGCAGGDAAGSDGSGSGGEVELTYMDEQGNCAAGPAEGIDFETAQAYIKSFEKPAEELLVTEPLPEPVSPDTTVAFLNNDSAVAGIMYSFMEQAAATAGVELINVSTGTDAQSTNSALNSVVEMNPDIVIAVANDATFWQDQLKQLLENDVAVVYASQTNAEEFGLNDTLGGYNVSLVNGKVLADAAVTFTCGTGTEFVFYNIPEFGFSQIQLEAAQEELAEICPDCNMRVVDISIADPSPADKIVSDLQSHPETQFFVTPADQFQIGLAEKAGLAGIENAHGIGQSSLPPNMQQIADGLQTAGFGVDLNIFMWMLLDEGFRKMQGVFTPYEDWEHVGQSVSRVITPANAEDYLEGFVAYPGMEDDFAALWSGK